VLEVHRPSAGQRSPRRIATISLHTSPLDQPGTGDAGGLNVYVVEVARQLARRGVEVEIFTRAVCPDAPPAVELVPGVLVRNVVAGPFEELSKNSLPGQICPFTFGVLRTEADFAPGYYDLVHAHYWLSGQVAAVAAERWGVPLIQSMHTLGKVKNLALAAGDCAEPAARIRARARSWRLRTGSWPTPRKKHASWSSCTAPTPGGSRRSARGWTYRCSGPARRRPPGPGWACLLTR